MAYIMKIIVKWPNILNTISGMALKLSVQQVYSGQNRIISAEDYLSSSEKVVYGRNELDSNDDNKVIQPNCCIFLYNVK